MAEEYHHDPAYGAHLDQAQEHVNISDYHHHQAAVAAAVAAGMEEDHANAANQDGLPHLPPFKSEDVEYEDELGEEEGEGEGEVEEEGEEEEGEEVAPEGGEEVALEGGEEVALEGGEELAPEGGEELTEEAEEGIKEEEDQDPPIVEVAATVAMTAEEIGAVTAAVAAAPLELRPKKKRKKNEEFTVAKKLEILEELDGKDAPTVQALAVQYGTTKTSIYRWKKDKRRLVKLVRKEGKGEFKRASLKRKMNNEEFTTFEKLSMIRELEAPEMTVRKLADKHGANKKSIYRWIKDKDRLVRIVETEGKGACKRVGNDPLQRVKDSVAAFYDQNALLPPGEKLTFTGAIVAAKAKQSKDHFLAEHSARPFLSDQEVKMLSEFTASESWGRKILQRNGWSSGKRKSAVILPKNEEGEPLNIGDAAMGTPKPRPRQPAKAAKTKQTAAQKRLRNEITTLRTDMGDLRQRTEGAEERELRLANENEELRREIAWLKMRQM